jgi:hypothetical protein
VKETADPKKNNAQNAAAQLNGSLAKVATLPKKELRTQEAKKTDKGLA